MTRHHGIAVVLSFAFLSAINASPAAAAEKNPLLDKLIQTNGRADLRQQASLAGKDRALLCSYCHGEDGNSLKPDVPNLAGQNPQYLLEQIGRFARGERKDYVMNSLASKFTDQDQINLAVYYASQKVRTEKFDPNLTRPGKKLYMENCQACHGKDGKGNTSFARLAGQKAVYLSATLTRFRDNALSQPQSGKRRSTVMEPVASRLTDQEIRQLSAFLASLR